MSGRGDSAKEIDYLEMKVKVVTVLIQETDKMAIYDFVITPKNKSTKCLIE